MNTGTLVVRWFRESVSLLARPPAVRAWVVAASVAVLVAPTVVHAQGSTAPEITSTGPFTVTEGETAVATLTADDSDTDAASLMWSKTGGADGDHFTLTSAGVLTFAAAKDFEDPDDADADGSYEVTVQVSDGTDIDTAHLVVTLANAIELTAITGPTAVTFAENGGGRVATFSASSDADRAGIQWTITGNDSDHFTIDSPPGALRFHIDPVSPNIFPSPPDFENPDDADTSNGYSITLLALVGSEISSPFMVTVTVTDVDEAGSISLSSERPRAGTALTATLSDPDGVTDGTVTWQWERSTGRNQWAAIDGATTASYTPVAADTNAFLRVTATYDDEHDTGHAVRQVSPNVVLGPLLGSLNIATGNSDGGASWRQMRPSFDADVTHYAVGCADDDSMTLTLSTADATARIAVEGASFESPSTEFTTSVDVTGESDVSIVVSDSTGAFTEYVVSCLATDFPEFEVKTRLSDEEVLDELIAFPTSGYLLVVDSHGVPRYRVAPANTPRTFVRFYPDGGDGEYRWSYTLSRSNRSVVLDENLEALQQVSTVSPLTVTGGHDFRVLPSGNFLLMAYQPKVRNLSHLTFTDENGNPFRNRVSVADSAIQVVTPQGAAVFMWNSWDHMPLEDCAQHRFPPGHPDWAHLNSTQPLDGKIIGSFRGCNRVLAIDASTGDVVWRVGPTNLSSDEWAERDVGPEPLAIIGDPRVQFCGQHAAEILPNGNLLLYDNGVHCTVNPWTGETPFREGWDFSRAVEYALDLDNGEAVFLRHHSLHGDENIVGSAGGHVESLSNGDWLISWGLHPTNASPMFEPPYPADEVATQVDPLTGVQKFALTGPDLFLQFARATIVPPEALAPQRSALTASFPASTSTSVFHTGDTGSPQVVVEFNRPVADFDQTSPSLSVSGATVDSVSAHVATGEPANAYLVTLTPDGDGAITFNLLAGETCDDGGICTADGATLSSVPAALVIGGPVTVSFERAAYSVREGATLTIAVRLSSAHQGLRGVTVPVVLDASVSASSDDLTGSGRVIFAAGETRKTLTVKALHDDLVEGAESATLAFGTLPDGVTAGTTPTSTVTITDPDRAQISFTAAMTQVAEGGETQLTFAITNGVTFEYDQTIELSIGGSATPDDDFALVDESNQTLTDPYELTFPSGASSLSVTVRVVDDSEIEREAETITLHGTLASTGAAVGTTQTLTIPPSDVPDTPEVSIAAGSTVTEGEAAVFTLTRTASTSIPFSSPLIVSVAATERGSTLGAGPPTTARFEAGDVSIDVPVPTLDDRVVEPAGAVTLLLLGSTSNPPAYVTVAVNAATVAVNDNDVAAFTLSANAEEVAEGGAVTVTIAGDGVTFAEAQTLALALAGTATPADDFTLAAHGDELSDPYTVALPAGAISAVVAVQTAHDGVDDVGETIELTVSHDGNTIGAVTITIVAPPPAPIVFIGGGAGGGGPGGPEPSEVDFEWTVDRDIEELDSGHDKPTGAWSDGVTLWLLDNPDGAGDAVYAYDLASGERVDDREFDLDDTNRAPRGFWSDRTTTWVSDSGQDKLFAHDIVTGERTPERDIALDRRNADPRGIWSDGETVWVLDGRRDALFAYDLSSGEPLGEYELAEASSDPRGIWSDGVTVWVSDHGAKRIFAYRLPVPGDEPPEDAIEMERVTGEDFAEPGRVGNNSPRGIWSDGDVMYVADANDDKVYSYNMPDAIDARLATLTLSGVDIGEFDGDVSEYGGVPDDGVTQTTVAAAAAQDGASVDIDPADAAADAAGHQVDLEGVTEISVTVTSPDGSREQVYRVALLETGPAPTCLRGAVSVGFSLVVYEGGSIDDLVACAASRAVMALYVLDEGVWVSHILGAPDFVNAPFRALFEEGVPALLPLVVLSEGLPTPAAAASEITEPFATCLRGEIAEGFSLVVYEGGSVADLDTCAESLGVTAVYALVEGEWASYILGAPDFANRSFQELFADGLPAATPLTVR